MLVSAYLAGRELRPLHDQHTQARDWEEYVKEKLAPLESRTANNYLVLDAAFRSVEEVRALKLNLAKAYKLAREILKGEPSGSRRDPKDAGRSFARRTGSFRKYLEQTALSGELAWMVTRDCQSGIENLAAIVQLGQRAINGWERRRQGVQQARQEPETGIRIAR